MLQLLLLLLLLSAVFNFFLERGGGHRGRGGEGEEEAERLQPPLALAGGIVRVSNGSRIIQPAHWPATHCCLSSL